MNIFKILASGDGSINEPNVSAFLGYLLNPKADHGIGDELLKRVLLCLYERNKESSLKDFLIDKNCCCRNLSANSNFDIEVLLEQSFKSSEQDKKEIVDIVILCFEKKIRKTESLAKIVISNPNKGELKQIFLIENKIRDVSSREGQLKDQFYSTIKTLMELLNKTENEIEKILSIIFITPFGNRSNDQYLKLEKVSIPKLHIYWGEAENQIEDDSNNKITFFLKDILLNEAKGEIEAINEYTKSTIKSFITFVENNFKSSIKEELEGQTIKDIDYDFKVHKEKYYDNLNEDSWKLIEEFQEQIKAKYNFVIVRYSRTHPVSIFTNENDTKKKIFSLTRAGRQIKKIQLIYRNHKINNTGKDRLLKYLDKKFPKNIEMKDRIIEINFKYITLNDALEIFEKQYDLIQNKYDQQS